MKRKLRINGHSHLLPYPEEIPQFMKDKGIFWVDKDRKFMLQKDWNRPITDSSFFLDEKLAWMERFKIDHAVVLNLSQLYGNGLRVEEMKQALRFQNDFNARIQRENPSKFTCGFVVHPGFVKGACWEIERCVEELDMQLLCLPTHYMDTIGTWRCIFDEENEPIFELASKYNLAVEIHPYDGEKFIKLENTACFAHGGQLAQINLGRRIQGFDGRPDLFEGKHHPRKAVGHKNIFFDTLVHDTGSLQLLIKNQTSKQVLMGLDDPYPLGEMESTKQSSYPGKILDLAIERNIISEEERDAMWEDNVIQWLCGDNEDAKQKLINRILN